MLRDKKIAVVIAAYNEEKLIAKTVTTLPKFIDRMYVIDDCSTDNTNAIIKGLAKDDSRVHMFKNDPNRGLGATFTRGFEEFLKEPEMDYIVTMPGDAQADPDYIKNMFTTLHDNDLDYVKANRFVDLDELQQMPKFRRIGNIVITIITKFASGYYSIFDSQNGYGIFPRRTIERMRFADIGKRYDYENTLLIALAVMGARVRDEAVPAIYGEETSTIPFFRTVFRALNVLWRGFWKRIYYRYMVVNFHPIALLLISGLFLLLVGLIAGIAITVNRLLAGITPSTATVMLSILPIFLGFQLLLTSLLMDMGNEAK
jgi:glycosyltransferase involved in cell wall biosynthesis